MKNKKDEIEPFDPYDHMGFLTNRIGRLLANHMSDSMEKEGIHFPPSCIGILADLWAGDGINQKELGSSLIKTKSSINKMLAALEADGMIIKENDPEDKRGKLIYLTQRGKDMRHKIENASACCDMNILSKVSAKDLQTAKRVLGLYYETLLQNTIDPTKS